MKLKNAIQANNPDSAIRDLPLYKLLGVSQLPKQLSTLPIAEDTAKKPDHVFPARPTLAMLWALSRGRPVMLVGPKGSGKSSLGESLARLCGLPAHRFQCHGDLEPMDLFGSKGIKDGNTCWEDGSLSYARRNDQMVIIDEVDSLQASAQMGLLGYLENLPGQDFALPGNWSNGPMTLPTTGDQPIIMTCNTGGRPDMDGGYVGAGELNTALLDRCVIVHLDYMQRDAERMLLQAKTGYGPEFIDFFLSAADHSRRMYKAGDLNEPISTRSLIEWIVGTPVLGFDLSSEINILEKVKDDRDRQEIGQILHTSCGELNDIESAIA